VGGDETQSLAGGAKEPPVKPNKESFVSGVFDLVGRYKWAALASLLVVVLELSAFAISCQAKNLIRCDPSVHL